MSHPSVRPLGAASLVALSILACWCASAAAQAPGLPRTYDVTRIDSPIALADDTFGFGIVNAGDLDADGVDDILTSQGTRILGDGVGAKNGELIIVSGANGSIIEIISAPESEGSIGSGPTENRSAAFGFYFSSIGRNASGGVPQTDLASCPGGNNDFDGFCDAATIGGPDGIPDIVASALFVDRKSAAASDGFAEDIGRVYVIDGATFAFLKRLDMPQADVDDLADETETLSAATPLGRARPWFGRTVLVAAGQPPCAGNMGVGPCTTTPLAVRSGDLDGAGLPDIVVGASAYKYEEAEGTNPACDDTPAVDTCIRSGRLYMYRGEDIVGTSPDAPLATASWNIRNPYAQADDPNTRIVNQPELFGHSIAPIGDVGRCSAPPNAAGFCPAANIVGVPDGRPDVLVANSRVDYPTNGPDNEDNFDIGVNLVLDGETGAVLQTYRHPDPDPGSLFGFTIYNQPVVGNAGGTATAPEIFIPAVGQDTDTYRGEGIGFLMNGASLLNGDIVDLQRFPSPNPASSRSFGATAAGSARFDRDGMTDLGRIYVFRSNNTPAPPPPPPPVAPPPPPPAAPPPPPPAVAAAAGRTLDLVASPARVRRGANATFSGTLESFANAARCQAGQSVEIQRRPVGSAGYATVTRATTVADGRFTASLAADRTSFYRARVAQDAECLGAVSQREQVDVTPAVQLVTKTARLTRNRQIRLQVNCSTADGPCNGTVKLRTANTVGGRKRTLPTASFQSPGNARRSVTITVSAPTYALLRRNRTQRMQAFVVGRDARGNSTTITARLTIRTR